MGEAFDVDYRSVERELHCLFYLILKEMLIKERSARNVIEELWRAPRTTMVDPKVSPKICILEPVS